MAIWNFKAIWRNLWPFCINLVSISPHFGMFRSRKSGNPDSEDELSKQTNHSPGELPKFQSVAEVSGTQAAPRHTPKI
jgi:hypothetical protein